MNDPKKILIIRLSSIGDIILATPMIRVLRKRFPQAQIDFVIRCEYAELIHANPYINRIYEFDTQTGFGGLRALKKTLSEQKYDLVIDIHNNLRSLYLRLGSGNHRNVVIDKRVIARTFLVLFKKNLYAKVVSVSDRYIEPLLDYGIQNDNEGLDIFLPENVRNSLVGKIPIIAEEEKFIGLCPSAKHETKRWLPERFVELSTMLYHAYHAKILIFGGPEDTQLCKQIVISINQKLEGDIALDCSGKLSVLETASAMQHCVCVVTNDSGLMHIASALKKKVVAIFGSTVKEFGFYPVGTEQIVLERNDLRCRPCSHIGRDHCPKRHFKCMKNIVTREVFNACEKLLTNQ